MNMAERPQDFTTNGKGIEQLTSNNAIRTLSQMGFQITRYWSRLSSVLDVPLDERIRHGRLAAVDQDYHTALESCLDYWITNDSNHSMEKLCEAARQVENESKSFQFQGKIEEKSEMQPWLDEVSELKCQLQSLRKRTNEEDEECPQKRQKVQEHVDIIGLQQQIKKVTVPSECSESPHVFKVHSGGFRAGECAYFMLDGRLIPGESKRGINVVILESSSQSCHRETFDTCKEENESSKFCEFINLLQIGTLIGIGVRDDAEDFLTEDAKKTMKSLGGKQFVDIEFRSSYALVAIIGHPDYTLEALAHGKSPATVSYWLPANGVSDILNDQSYILKVTSAGYQNGGMPDIQAVHLDYSFGINNSSSSAGDNLYAGFVNPKNKLLSLKTYDTCGSLSTLETELIHGQENIIYVFAKAYVDGNFSDSFHDMMETLGSKSHKKLQHSCSWIFIGNSSNKTAIAEAIDHKAKVAIATVHAFPMAC